MASNSLCTHEWRSTSQMQGWEGGAPRKQQEKIVLRTAKQTLLKTEGTAVMQHHPESKVRGSLPYCTSYCIIKNSEHKCAR